MDLAKAIIWTEQKIRQFETRFPPNGISAHEWLMWLPKTKFPQKDSTSLTLKKSKVKMTGLE